MWYDILYDWYQSLFDVLGVFQRDVVLLLGMLVAAASNRLREFLRYWGPFLFLWICYDMMRGVADNLGEIHVKEIYDLELLFFGWMFNDKIPAFWMKDNIQSHAMNVYTGFIYTLHPVIPFLLGFSLFYISKDKEAFKEFSYTFLLTTYMALLTFVLYPVAPPWYVYSNGFVQPYDRTGLNESAAGLINLDNYFKTEFYGTVYGTFNANPFAAMPSLHSAFAVLSCYFFIKNYRHKTPFTYLSVIYPLSVWFAAVYLQHHYILDLIAGALYVFIAARIIEWRLAKNHTSAQDSSEELSPIPNTAESMDSSSTQELEKQ